MNTIIGIRKEDKNRWERRTPLIPDHIKELTDKYSLKFMVQPSENRIFPDKAYARAGAALQNNLSSCEVILAVKEIPPEFFEHGKIYLFFSHTIKGQSYNMPMLKRLLDLKCILIDYEKIVDENNRRLIFFGRYAGIVGMIDTLWALGKRLTIEGISNPFNEICQTLHYSSLADAKRTIKKIGKNIEKVGIPQSILPLICGFAGYGNVSLGAQEILDLLPVKEIEPKQLQSVSKNASTKHVYKVVFKEQDIVEHFSGTFNLHDYYEHPKKYISKFETYIPYLTVLMNCIYWNDRYPRLITKEYISTLFKEEKSPHLKIIGDISCDIDGSIEFTVKCTDSGNPVYVYNPLTKKVIDGFEGKGVLVMAVDNLPCELPKDSSTFFSNALFPFILELSTTDFSSNFDDCTLSPPLKNAVIAYKGELTPDYRYLYKYLNNSEN